jgi:hypothetical protein
LNQLSALRVKWNQPKIDKRRELKLLERSRSRRPEAVRQIESHAAPRHRTGI